MEKMLDEIILILSKVKRENMTLAELQTANVLVRNGFAIFRNGKLSIR